MTRNPTFSLWRRRLVLAGGILWVVALAVCLAIHLYGRARLKTALAEYERELGARPVRDFASLERALPPEHENAAVWLQAGAEALIWSEEEKQLVKETALLPWAQWPAGREARVRELLERNRAGLGILHRAAGLEQFNYGILYRHGAGLEIPGILNQLDASFLLNIEARLAFEDGESARGLLAVRTLSRLVSALDGEQVYIFSMVAIACERVLVGVLLDVARGPRTWADTPALLGDLAATLPARDPVARARELTMLDASALAAAASSGYRERGEGPVRPAWGLRYLFGRWGAAEVLTVARQVVPLTELPYPEARERFAALPEPTLLDHWQAFDLDLGYRKGLFHGAAKHQKIAAQRQLARIALAIRQLGFEAGAYPAERPPLAGLGTPDPFTGRHLLYERRDDGSALVALDGSEELAREDLSTPSEPLTSFHRVVLPVPGE